MAYLDFANFWFVSSITKGNNSFLYQLTKLKNMMSNFCFPLPLSFKRLSCEGIVNDMNFKVQIFIIIVKSNQKIDQYTLY
jgi:hypothetical protein